MSFLLGLLIFRAMLNFRGVTEEGWYQPCWIPWFVTFHPILPGHLRSIISLSEWKSGIGVSVFHAVAGSEAKPTFSSIHKSQVAFVGCNFPRGKKNGVFDMITSTKDLVIFGRFKILWPQTTSLGRKSLTMGSVAAPLFASEDASGLGGCAIFSALNRVA